MNKSVFYKVILGLDKDRVRLLPTLKEAQEFAEENVNEFGSYEIVEVTVIEKTIDTKLEWL